MVKETGTRSLLRRRCFLGLALGVGLIGAAVAPASTAGAEISVARHAFARQIVGKEPSASATSFPTDVGTLYFFTQVVGATPAAELIHVWLYDGQEVAIYPVDIQGSPWRTWSARIIDPTQRGDWTVEVREVGGKVLLSATCRIE